jgi:hypothetical protein
MFRVLNRRPLDENICNGCRYHSFRSFDGGAEQHMCVFTEQPQLLRRAVTECTEFYPGNQRNLREMEPIAWTAELTRGRVGFREPGTVK